jgi:hypothetical protein
VAQITVAQSLRAEAEALKAEAEVVHERNNPE